MTEKVDARGLSCPQPVLLALSKMRDMKTGELEVLVDNEVSKENVSRAASKEGWELAQVREEAEEYHLLLRRS
ncbi:MAG: sulfurtransferase TusA family protein [Desulfomonile tiedjei]|uniref:Sulfurtransferase TusA family protein n=1 Tax=Desulfomonile tiedjei TaxID=2358 RepID=A0A9D6Z332_9BACT|nr:sulfurtransferase TusA family protein [Desulfomonile tiedjei]